MHNLHLILVSAENAEDACDVVESHISDFGNENNWRSICGCVSQDDEVHIINDGRYPPDADDTIEKINKMVVGWLTPYASTDKLIIALNDGSKKLSDITDYMDWLRLESYADHMQNVALLGKKDSFDILAGDEFKSCEFDEVGVTDITEGERIEGNKLYVVFVDMHS